MGLLSRAASRTVPELDAMGKALRDRILRLPRKKTAPYTALSLLKAYASFQSGFCLALKKEVYSSYAGLGPETEKISVPKERFLALFGGDFSKTSYLLGSPDFIPPELQEKSLVFWGFPLDEEAPWKGVLLLGAGAASDFNPGGMERMLRDIRAVLLPPQGREGEKVRAGVKEGDGSPFPPELEKELSRFYRTSPSSAGIVLEASPNLPEAEGPLFQERLLSMVSLIGTAVALAPRRSLVLLPAGMDRELIAHRIAKSLDAKSLLVFEAGSPGKALSAIHPFLS
jgi:hypothetical protein